MTFRLQRYNPDPHAGSAAPKYAQSHVVTGRIPLSRIDFDPRSEELAVMGVSKHRTPGTCPRFNELTADSYTPPIQGAETRQSLGVNCLELAYVNANDAHGTLTAWPVCLAKAEGLNLDVERIPGEWFADRDKTQPLLCPFVYLGCAAVQRGNRVEIAITSHNPLGGARFEPV